jgi:alpha-amylase/alpha-mannosidase (GH57 family)
MIVLDNFGAPTMHSKSSKEVIKRKFRSKLIRNETERQMLKKIASFFDETDKAYSLLRRNINNGYFCTPDKDVPIQEFLEAHQEAWEKRQGSGAAHSISILQNSIVKQALTVYSSSGLPRNLDEIENCRDHDGQYETKYGKYYPK